MCDERFCISRLHAQVVVDAFRDSGAFEEGTLALVYPGTDPEYAQRLHESKFALCPSGWLLFGSGRPSHPCLFAYSNHHYDCVLGATALSCVVSIGRRQCG